MTPTEVPTTEKPYRPSIKELIATRILDQRTESGAIVTSQPDFEAWMRQGWTDFLMPRERADKTEGRGEVRDQATAKTMIATWIEDRLKAQNGVWFGPQDTSFTLGLTGRQPIQVNVPTWITDYIRSFPLRPQRAPANANEKKRAVA